MRLRFSFRALLIAFTAIGVGVGMFAMEWNAARRQAELVSDLRHADANVWYAYEAPSMSQGDPLDERQRLFFPKVSDWKVWLGRQFGRDFAFDVAGVDLHGPVFPADLIARLPQFAELDKLYLDARPGLDDEAWQAALTCRQIAELQIQRHPFEGTRRLTGLSTVEQLQRLTIEGGELTVEDAEEIAGIAGLRELTLRRVSVTDESLRPLAKLKQVEKLWLVHQGRGKKTTSAGVAFIKEMPALRSLQLARIESLDNDVLPIIAELKNLESLDLGSAAIDGSQLSCLEQLSQLKSLNLIGTKVDDDAMRRLPQLESLTISFTEVSDAGIAHLVALRSLRELSLSGAEITDRCASSLARMTKLQDLKLYQTDVGDVGLESLAGLPELRSLWISDNAGISQAAITKFKAAHPKCGVY